MSIPDYQNLMLPILRISANGEPHPLAQIREQVADELELSAEDLAQRLASGSQTVFANRVAWAVQFLKEARVLESVKRGVYKITDRGRSLLRDSPVEITTKTLRQFPEFVEFQGNTSVPSTGAAPAPSVSVETKDTPEELLENNFQLLQEALANDLLDAVQNGTPAFFEKIVVDLLVAMGYGGSVEDAGKVVGKSGDGGIDGVIKQDKLGLDALYVQAKRWKDIVGSPEIMKFSGGLTKKNASRGVFITASGFTKDALEYVQALPQKIVLIDGKKLATLMIEHNVGVAPAKTFTLKRLDQDYFETA